MSSWKPSFIKNNKDDKCTPNTFKNGTFLKNGSFIKKDKFKDIPNKMEFTWNKRKEENILGSKIKKCKIDDTNFPSLGKKDNNTMKMKCKTEDENNSQKVWNSEKKVNWENSIKEEKKDDIEKDTGFVWLGKNVNTESNTINENQKTEESKLNEWTEEDEIDEYFETLHKDTLLDLHETIISYCNEKNLPFYDSYDRFYNFINLVKDNSTAYNKMFIKEETEENENNEEEEIIDEELI